MNVSKTDPDCMDDSEAAITVYAKAFLAGGQAASDTIDGLKARCARTGDNFILMQVVYTLTHHERVVFFEHFFDCEPCQVLALTELVKSCAWTGRPDKAIKYAEQLEGAGLISSEMECFVATQYARIGHFDLAREYLNKAYDKDESLQNERAISLEFFDFLQHFDYDATLQMYNRACEIFKPAPLEYVEKEIADALNNGTPYLLLRMGDGEGAWIHLGEDEERKRRSYFAANRKEFLQIWFKNEEIIDDEEFYEASRLFNEAIGNADCLGGIYREAIDVEFSLGSRRGIAWVVNVLRKILKLAEQSPQWARNTRISHLGIHYDLILSGVLPRLLEGASKIGLISCHAELPVALAQKYNIDEIEFYKIPGEQSHSEVLGQNAVEGRHWPDRYRELCQILDEPKDRRGQLFLIAAGLLGKVYAWKLRQAGAVVIDIGAVADLWMGKNTRVFPDLPAEARLPPDPERITLVDIGGLGGLQEIWRPHLDKIFPVVFEPNNAEADVIRQDLGGVGQVLTVALGNRSEVRSLYITKSLGCTSLLRPNSNFLHPYSISPAFRVLQEISVPCTRYHDLYRRGEVRLPDVVKIDTQGFEFEILEGFGDLLNDVLAVQLEAHLYPIYHGQKLLHEIVHMLQPFGLVLRRVTPVDHFDGDVVEVDAWFTCDLKRLSKLSPIQKTKLSFVESVWKLPDRRKSFGETQFQ